MASSPSSASFVDEKDKEVHSASNGVTVNHDPKDPSQEETEASILPEVQQKAQPDAEKAIPDGPPNDPSKNPFDPRNNPDGGTQAWLCALGGWCVLFASFGWINCIGVFQDYYQTHQLSNYSPGTIAWIPSLESTASLNEERTHSLADTYRSVLYVLLRTRYRKDVR